MTFSFHTLGNPEYRPKRRFDPDLADRENKRCEAEERRKKLEAKLRGESGKPEEPAVQEPTTPLIIPDINTQYSFLGGDLGKQIDERIHQKYSGIEAIAKINFNPQTQLIEGSNSFYVVAVNEVLRTLYPDRTVVTASQADLEKILKANSLQLSGHYEDSALILRSIDAPNEYLAKDLMKQVKTILKTNLQLPLMIPLNNLNLRIDSDSLHGLSLDLTEYSELIYAPELVKANNLKKFNDTDNRGMPIFNTQGTRTLYTMEKGLSWLCLGGYLDLGSWYEFLADSNSGGRVVVVAAEGSARKNSGGTSQ